MSKWIVLLLPGLLSGLLSSAVACDGAVRGHVRRPVPAHRALGAHVHVQLLDAEGKVIAWRMTALPPTAPRKDASANQRVAYHVHFEDGDMARAASHRAVFHLKAHPL